MAGAAKTDGTRLASLDILRLIAALAVVNFHYLFRGTISGDLDAGYPEVAPLAIYGYLGVSLFFLISGFVIAWSAQGRTWKEFAIARFARLYPGFLVCMTATFLILVVAHDPRFPTNASIYVANLSMFARILGKPAMDGVYWSIMFEIVFYGWVAMLMLAGAFQRWRLAIVAAWLAISAANVFLIQNEALRFLFLTDYAPYFAIGILAQYIVTRGRSFATLALIFVAFLVSCRTITFAEDWMQSHYGVSISYPDLLAANLLVYSIFVAAILLRSTISPSRTVLMLGGLTYPLYLLHQFIGYISLNALAPKIGRSDAFFVVLTGMLLAAFLVWRFIETPVRKPLIRALMSILDRKPVLPVFSAVRRMIGPSRNPSPSIEEKNKASQF